MATVTRDSRGNQIWRGQTAEVPGVTAFQTGDKFYAWDTGMVFEILDPGVGWELVSRGVPTPTSGTVVEALKAAY